MTEHGPLVRTIVLAGWTVFFAYLWLSKEMARYLGPRTYWVVAFGTVTLAFATVVNALRLRRGASGGRERLVPILAMLIPLIAVIAIPAPQLGALAASRKSQSLGLASASSIVPPTGRAGKELSFVDVHYASESEKYAGTVGISEGLEMKLTGFVTHGAGTSQGGFQLTRFYVSCCAADAIPYSVRVQPDEAQDFEDDTWLQVDGTLAKDDGGYFLVPNNIAEVDTPQDPYLY